MCDMCVTSKIIISAGRSTCALRILLREQAKPVHPCTGVRREKAALFLFPAHSLGALLPPSLAAKVCLDANHTYRTSENVFLGYVRVDVVVSGLRKMTKQHKIYSFLFASSFGTYLEFFDLGLYSFCAGLIAKEFFPAADPMAGILATWGIFAISYLMRPIAAVWFGHLADAKSSKRAMILSMGLMASATVGIGLLPTYATIGIWAPILLLLLRILQSIAVSPEYSLPSVFIKNNAWFAQRFGLVSSITACVTGLGMMSSSWIVAHTLAVNPSYWRVPFVAAGLLLGTLGLYFRLNVDESALPPRQPLLPIKAVVRRQPLDFLLAIFIAGYVGCISYSLFGFLLYQLQSVKLLSSAESLSVLNSGVLLPSIFALIAGYLSDTFSRRYLMLAAASIIGVAGFCLFGHISVLELGSIRLLVCILLAGLGFFAGSFPGFLAELFAHEYRYTGAFLSYNLGMSWIGGVCPLLFISVSGINYHLPPQIILVYSILVMLLLETRVWTALKIAAANLLRSKESKVLVNPPK